MTPSFRSLALAFAVAGAVLPAQASQLSLNFEGLVPADAKAPVALGGTTFPDSTGLPAIQFSGGAFASNSTISSKVPAGHGGFGVDDINAYFKIDVLAGFDFDLLSLDFAVGSAGFEIWVTGRDALKTVIKAPVFGNLDGSWSWRDNQDVFALAAGNGPRTDVGLIQSVEFIGSGLFAIDNLRLDLSGGCTVNCGGTVPEPASFGIVALALLGAGLASRRRRA